MSDPLYKREILRLAADAHGAGHLDGPHLHGSAHNPACGDKIEVDLTLAGDRITSLAHVTKACVLAQASAAILGRDAKGLSRSDIQKLRTRVKAMLANEADVPLPPFDAYGAFDGVAPFRNRHACVLLPIDAVLAALETSDTE